MKKGKDFIMISQPDMLKIEALLETATDKQMSEIAQMFNEIRNKKTAAKARTFKVGQKVRWHGKRGYMEGVIEKVNKKNIIVDAGPNGSWRVTASLLNVA